MAAADFSSTSYQQGTRRQRAASAALALAIELLIALALIFAAPRHLVRDKIESALKTFSVTPAPEHEASTASAPKPVVNKQQPRAASAPSAPVATPPPVPIKAPAKPSDPKLIPMDFAGSDIGKVAKADTGDSDGPDTGSQAAAYGPGAGPGGQRLYNVAWYREPTHAELAGYLPNGVPAGGWAEIACKMIADYHVENCRPLGESPVGSGLARAMRQAAWQFLVRPPRIGDKQQLGTWVRIRIDFTDKGGE